MRLKTTPEIRAKIKDYAEWQGSPLCVAILLLLEDFEKLLAEERKREGLMESFRKVTEGNSTHITPSGSVG